MSLRSIMFILVEYLDFKSLEILCQIIEIPEFIWRLYLDNNYKVSLNPRDIIKVLELNSIKISNFKRLILQDIIDSKSVNRIFKFIHGFFVFSTYNGRFYQYRYKIFKEIDHVEIFSLCKKPLEDRIMLDCRLDDYEDEYLPTMMNEINEIGLDKVIQFSNLMLRYFIKDIKPYFKDVQNDHFSFKKMKLDLNEFDVLEMCNSSHLDQTYFHDSFDSFDRLNVVIIHYQNKFIFFKCRNYLRTASLSYHVIVRDSLKEIFDSISDKNKKKVIRGY